MATDCVQMKEHGGRLEVPSSSANNSSSEAALVTEKQEHHEHGAGENTRYCCCCCWRPGFLQCFASIRWFLVFVCFLVTSTALMIAIFQGNLTTTETRYQLSASQLGLAASMFTVGTVISTIFVTHFGGRPESHRPRWIGIGAVTMATGCFILCLPQFIFGPYEYTESISNSSSAISSSPEGLCELDNSVATMSSILTCDDEKHQLVYESYVAYIMIVIGQLVIGFGYGPLMPLALAFIDDNIDTSTTGLYSGIMESMWGVGGIIGFQVSASIVGLWVDFYRVDTETIEITPRDPRYVGAWWLGLLIATSLFLLFSIPFWGFPKKLVQNGCHQHDQNNGLEHSNDSHRELPRNKTNRLLTFKELIFSIWRLCRNKVYVSLCGSMMMQGAIIYSFSAFLPKYLETQFGLPTKKANITVGLILLPAFGLGAIVGGILVKRLNLAILGSTMMSMVCSLSCTLLAIAFVFIGCQNQPVAGITAGYQNQSLTVVPSLDAPCNADCGCSSSLGFSPVCGSDGITYFSPCHAACLDVNENKTLIDCECVATNPEFEGNDSQASKGPCPYTGCGSLIAFLVFMFIGNFLLACIVPPRIVIIVSCVEFTDKSIAIGVSRIIMLLLGSIPGPILYGALIDTSCILWQTICDTRGSCWVYDIEQFRHVFGMTTTLILAVQFAFFVLIWIFLKFSDDASSNKQRAHGEAVPAATEGKPIPD
ncbi:solute carrier organic anion transporter family member 5A1-like [Amphiura filiformis]|uniref:solute carrier organic anion transporter family member 5A1-like n=1 Tax=Amphiura filiformis TaxID=82378 RepID=UPI003B21838A